MGMILRISRASALGLLWIGLVSAAPNAALADGEPMPILCEDLVDDFHRHGTTIDSAAIVSATETSPEYCDVRGLIGEAREPGKGIRFAVWLPVQDDWNKRFYMVGGSGFAGVLELDAMTVGLDQGFATAATDTGHDASVFPLATFAFNDRESEKDFGFRAVHRTAVTAKALIKAHYRKRSEYNYWVGCSMGGRQGLMEAQRFPRDFDGMIIGAPVLDLTGTGNGYIWTSTALLDEGAISLAKLPLLSAAELANCDGTDGLMDGQITDPNQCSFDAVLDLPACTDDVDGPDCFTLAQREAVNKIYDGPETSTGKQLFPGYAVGTGVVGPPSGWIPWIASPFGISLHELIGASALQYLVFRHDPGPEYVWQDEFDFDVDPFRMRRARRIFNATNPNMKKYSRRGGKIMQFHGWADPANTPHMSTEYYDRVVRRMGRNQTEDFYKLYMAPAMFHCDGGPGPNTFDLFTPLMDWVEDGIEPEEIIASHPGSGRTRPLCTYPMTAHYVGTGSIEEAENFECIAPPPPHKKKW